MESHWNGYLNAFDKQVIRPPSSSNAYTGFLNLKPNNPEIQARYDAMSGNWEGIKATNKALANGLFSTDPMPFEKQTNHKK